MDQSEVVLGRPTGSSSSAVFVSRRRCRPSSSTSIRPAGRQPPRTTCSWPSSASPPRNRSSPRSGGPAPPVRIWRPWRPTGSSPSHTPSWARSGSSRLDPAFPVLLERLGISVTENRAGRLKGMGAPWRDETDEERAKEQAVVDAFYDAFVSRVAKGRHVPEATARDLATGEIWLGERGAGPGARRRDRRPGTGRRAGRQGRRRAGSLGSGPASSIAGRLVDRTVRHEPRECRRGRDRGPPGEPPADVIRCRGDARILRAHAPPLTTLRRTCSRRRMNTLTTATQAGNSRMIQSQNVTTRSSTSPIR